MKICLQAGINSMFNHFRFWRLDAFRPSVLLSPFLPTNRLNFKHTGINGTFVIFVVKVCVCVCTHAHLKQIIYGTSLQIFKGNTNTILIPIPSSLLLLSENILTSWFTCIVLSTKEIFVCCIYLVVHPYLRGPGEGGGVSSASFVVQFWQDFVDVVIS